MTNRERSRWWFLQMVRGLVPPPLTEGQKLRRDRRRRDAEELGPMLAEYRKNLLFQANHPMWDGLRG